MKGLDTALEALAREQKAQEAKYTQRKQIVVKETGNGCISATVSLPASKRTSRRGSVDFGGLPPKQRSRRNSIDLYSADYDIKLLANKAANEISSSQKSEAKNSCHIRVDDMEKSKLKLCQRCHSHMHKVNDCPEFGSLKCPRCMEWSHWEDTCWTNEATDQMITCDTCLAMGHTPAVHEAVDFKQRRAIVDTLGWEAFQSWFYEPTFRSWWQLNGCLGVPLYRLYKRNTNWKSGGPIEPSPDDNSDKQPEVASIVDRAAQLAEKYNFQYNIRRDDSTDELLKSVHAQREARKKQLLSVKNNDNDDFDSGRSTPEHLKKYSGTHETTENKRLRTFSETLKLLDEDILHDLDVK